MTVPLVYKLLHNYRLYMLWVQLLLSIFSWGFFVLTLQPICRTQAGKMFLTGSTFLLGCSSGFILWDSMVLSRSISISLMLILTGSVISAVRHPTWQKHVCSGVVAFFWAFSRETNAWVLLLSVPFLVTLRFRNRKRLFPVMYILGITFIFIVSQYSSREGKRWMFPLLNVFTRILLIHKTRVGLEQGYACQ